MDEASKSLQAEREVSPEFFAKWVSGSHRGPGGVFRHREFSLHINHTDFLPQPLSCIYFSWYNSAILNKKREARSHIWLWSWLSFTWKPVTEGQFHKVISGLRTCHLSIKITNMPMWPNTGSGSDHRRLCKAGRYVSVWPPATCGFLSHSSAHWLQWSHGDYVQISNVFIFCKQTH